MKCIISADSGELKPYIGEDILHRLPSNRHLSYQVEGGGYLLSFYYLDIKKPGQRERRVSIYFDRDALLFITEDEHLRGLMSSCADNEAHIHTVFEFFSQLTAEDVDSLEHFEERITTLEDELLTGKRSSRESSRKIIAIRRELLIMKRYYEQLGLVTAALSDNEEGFFHAAEQKRFVAISRRTDRLLESVLHLREYITQVREAYQAQIDIEQNNIMRIFTVITAIFLPLTLIVGWYGMNFQMPEYAWPFGYPFVILLSAVILALTFLLFKIKKWF